MRKTVILSALFAAMLMATGCSQQQAQEQPVRYRDVPNVRLSDIDWGAYMNTPEGARSTLMRACDTNRAACAAYYMTPEEALAYRKKLAARAAR